MKPFRRPALYAALLLLPAMGAALRLATLRHEPRAVIVPATVDLGAIGPGQSPTASFLIQNTGDAPLTLSRAAATAGARVVTLPAGIPPGGRGEIKVQLDGAFNPGRLEPSVTLASNDPARPRLELGLTADVRQVIDIDPPEARFVTVQGEPPGRLRFRLEASDRDIDVTRVASPYPFMPVESTPAPGTPGGGGSRKAWIITIGLPSDAPVGPLSGQVEITTDHPLQPRAWIPVSGFVRPRFAVTPATVDLGTFDPVGDSLGGVVVKHFGADAVGLRRVVSTVPGLRGEIRVIEAGHQWRIGLKSAPALRGAFDGKLLISSTSRFQPVIEIPVRGLAARSLPGSAPHPGAGP